MKTKWLVKMNRRQWRSFFARTLSYFLFQGCLKCFGVILEGTVAVTHSNVALVGWSFMILQGVALLVGPVVSWLMDIFSYQFLSTLGGFLVGAGFLYQAFFANTLWKLMIANIASGFGFGMNILVTTVHLGEVFGNKFGLALAISTLLSSVSMMFLPVVLDYWLRRYGLSWAVGILGAVMWNCVPAGLLVFEKDRDSFSRALASEGTLAANCDDFEGPSVSHEAKNVDDAEQVTKQRRSKYMLIAHPALSFVILTRLFNTVIVFAWAVYLVPFGVEKGYDPSTAVFLATSGGAGILVGRAVCFAAFYYEWFENVPILVIGVILSLAVMLCFHFTQGFVLLSALSFIAGTIVSFYATWVQAYMKHIVCDKHFKSATAISSLVTGVGIVLTGFISGLFQGIRGSYNDVFIFLSFMAFCQVCSLIPTVLLVRPIVGDCVM